MWVDHSGRKGGSRGFIFSANVQRFGTHRFCFSNFIRCFFVAVLVTMTKATYRSRNLFELKVTEG